MKRFLVPLLAIACVGPLSFACSGTVGKDCTQNAKKVCTDGVTYWLDSCGKQGDKVADCGCGCNSGFTSCKEPCGCTPDCGSRNCGLDPVCGTLGCGLCSGATFFCNPATGVCQAELECPAITGSRDAIIKQNAPDANFGHVDYVEVGFISNGAYRSFSQFDIDAPAGTIIQSASLDLFWDSSSSSRSTPTALEVHRVDKSWAEDSLSWNKRDVNDAWDNPGGDWRDKINVAQGTTPYATVTLPVGNPANAYLSLDISQIVQEWLDGTHPNHGLMLKASNAGETIPSNHVQFVGLEDAANANIPRLLITTATCANDQVAAPIFSPPPGRYSAAQAVSISTATAGANIHFTLDGSEPAESSAIYSAAVTVSSSTTIKARAFKSGMAPSPVVTATYIIATSPAGPVKIWDSLVSESANAWDLLTTNAWANKANWTQITSTGTITFSGNTIIETDYIYLFLPANICTGCQPQLYQKLDNGNFISDNMMPYQSVWYGSEGYMDLYLNSFEIITNTANELIFIRDAASGSNPSGKEVIMWKLFSNKPWIEVIPQTSGRYDLGFHAGPHVVVAINSDMTGADWILDADDYELPCSQQSCMLYFPIPSAYIYALYPEEGSGIEQGHPANEVNILIPKDRGTGDLKAAVRRVTSPSQYKVIGVVRDSNVRMGEPNSAAYYAVVNQRNVLRTDRPNKAIAAGGSFTSSFKPSIAGQWRVSGRVNGVYYTQTRDVQAGGDLAFTSPVSGTLEVVVMYLYDRNSTTPPNVDTPQDIYRAIFKE